MARYAKTAELWATIQAYGTYEGEGHGIEWWSWNGDMYLLDSRKLPESERAALSEME